MQVCVQTLKSRIRAPKSLRVAFFSSNMGRKARIARMRANFEKKVEGARQGEEDKQLFETLHRELQRRAHPDVLRATHPVEADLNDGSMQIVNNLLSCVRESGNVIPDEFGGQLDFYLKPVSTDTDSEGELHKATLFLDTTGKRKIYQSFSAFFRDAGLGDGSGEFSWGNTYYSYPKFDGVKLPRTFKQ